MNRAVLMHPPLAGRDDVEQEQESAAVGEETRRRVSPNPLAR
jgi:hypothetical protein